MTNLVLKRQKTLTPLSLLTLRYTFLFLSFFLTDLLSHSPSWWFLRFSQPKSHSPSLTSDLLLPPPAIKPSQTIASRPKSKKHSILHCKSTPYRKPPPPLKTTAGHKTQRKKKPPKPKTNHTNIRSHHHHRRPQDPKKKKKPTNPKQTNHIRSHQKNQQTKTNH